MAAYGLDQLGGADADAVGAAGWPPGAVRACPPLPLLGATGGTARREAGGGGVTVLLPAASPRACAGDLTCLVRGAGEAAGAPLWACLYRCTASSYAAIKALSSQASSSPPRGASASPAGAAGRRVRVADNNRRAPQCTRQRPLLAAASRTSQHARASRLWTHPVRTPPPPPLQRPAVGAPCCPRQGAVLPETRPRQPW